MTTLIVAFVFLLAIFGFSVVWIFRALAAAVRREKRVWLFWGTPIALIAMIWAGQMIFLTLIGFAVALSNGGTGS